MQQTYILRLVRYESKFTIYDYHSFHDGVGPHGVFSFSGVAESK
jgi:hypothetical protein